MRSGTFGYTDARMRPNGREKDSVATHLMRRELGVDLDRASIANKLVAQKLMPSTKPDTIIRHDARVYSGQFSDDGDFFFSCGQDMRVHMYDTSNPYHWKHYKTVRYQAGQWTITDASLSPDNRFLAYSSIRCVVYLAPTDPNDHSEPLFLDFSNVARSVGYDRTGFVDRGDFGIWSVRFSGDGREIVAGTGDHCVYVYDIETRQTTLRIAAHDDDVNAVCFGDSSIPHILYSGSDDATVKVWDRRSMGDSREAGAFVGHTEGITYVDSKGDGRYVLSNSKDQSMKLWDLRKMVTAEQFDRLDRTNIPNDEFDYRFMQWEPHDHYRVHPNDGSLVSFRGHRVLKTLIRCHFSPPASTDSRYVYSGSEDGSVYIYNLDATVAGKIDVKTATKGAGLREKRDAYRRENMYRRRNMGTWETCVRDVSWHPHAPVVAGKSCSGGPLFRS